MGLKNHKPGCKCVGCSAATRKKGQKALESHRKGEAKAEKPAADKPKPSPKPKPKPSPRRTNPPEAAAQPAPSQPDKVKLERAKQRAEAKLDEAVQAERDRARKRGITLPSLDGGRFLTIHAPKGGGARHIKAHLTLALAREHAKGLEGRVYLVQVLAASD